MSISVDLEAAINILNCALMFAVWTFITIKAVQCLLISLKMGYMTSRLKYLLSDFNNIAADTRAAGGSFCMMKNISFSNQVDFITFEQSAVSDVSTFAST